jgi:uncharacterized protein YeaO (DUF488 family)
MLYRRAAFLFVICRFEINLSIERKQAEHFCSRHARHLALRYIMGPGVTIQNYTHGGSIMAIALKRAYDKPSASDGTRVLVDRLWPRGISKEEAHLDLWLKALAPSDQLRKWYHERPSMWEAFRQKYLEELRGPEAVAAFKQLQELASKARKLTLVFASRNQERNNAVVLKELLEGMKKPPHKIKREVAPAQQQARAQARR